MGDNEVISLFVHMRFVHRVDKLLSDTRCKMSFSLSKFRQKQFSIMLVLVLHNFRCKGNTLSVIMEFIQMHRQSLTLKQLHRGTVNFKMLLFCLFK